MSRRARTDLKKGASMEVENGLLDDHVPLQKGSELHFHDHFREYYFYQTTSFGSVSLQ